MSVSDSGRSIHDHAARAGGVPARAAGRRRAAGGRAARAACVAWAALAGFGACGGDGGDARPPAGDVEGNVNETSNPSAWRTVSPVEAARVQSRLYTTLLALAEFGEKRGGTPNGRAAGDYVAQRFAAAGLTDVAFEPFIFDGFELHSSSLSFTAAAAGGAAQPLP
ncbi:MAG TPA: hypothetical protein VFS00_24525, partial [Polyangiaceae bacterium]|nr:hypothetical protein [Polyangiaceae bacterium]